MSTSREKMIQQIERCVAHQKAEVEGGPVIQGPAEEYQMGEYIAPEVSGNGEEVQCEASAIWGLRPPGEETLMSDVNTGDWA